MSLLWVERYGGHYAVADLAMHFTSTTGVFTRNATGGRDSGPVLENTGNSFLKLERSLPAGNQSGTGIFGLVFKTTTFQQDGNRWIALIMDQDNTTVHLSIELVSSSDTRVCIRRGQSGTTIATGSIALQANSWYSLELKFNIHDTTGSLHMKLNRVDDIHSGGSPITGLDTRNGANGTWNRTTPGTIATTGGTMMWETSWVMNTSGSVNNDFLLDAMATALFPNAEGDTIEFTPSTGTDNSALVDETTQNGDTDYNENNSTGKEDLLQVQNIPAGLSGKTVIGAVICVNARQTDVGSGQLRARARTATPTDINGTDTVLGQSATYSEVCQHVLDTNPDTSARFTESQINSLQIGYRKTA